MTVKKPTGRSYAEFVVLNDAETCLKQCVAEGKAYIGEKSDKPEKQIRAAFLRFLILGGDEQTPVHEHGVQLCDCTIGTEEEVTALAKGQHKQRGALLDLTGCENYRIFSLKECTLPGDLKLDYSTGHSIFLDGTQLRRLTATRARFSGSLYLREGFTASRGVDISGAHIRGSLSCCGAVFRVEKEEGENEKKAPAFCFRVDDAVIDGALILGPKRGEQNKAEDVTLEGSVSLRGTRCKRFVDHPNSYSVINKQREEYQLNISGFTYTFLVGGQGVDVDFRKQWLSYQLPSGKLTGFNPQPHEQLALTLAHIGHNEAAKEISLEKNQQQAKATREAMRKELQEAIRTKKPGWLGRLMGNLRIARHWVSHLFLNSIIGYGYRPSRALVWLLAVWAIGIVIFRLAYLNGALVPSSNRVAQSAELIACQTKFNDSVNRLPAGMYLTEFVGGGKPVIDECLEAVSVLLNYPRFSAFSYSIDAFVPLISLRQEEFWIPLARNLPGTIARWYLYVHIFMGWVITSLGIAGLFAMASSRGTGGR